MCLTGATNLVVTGSIFASGSITDANITASGHISASGTGSFGHIKATTIEGNSPLNIKGINKLDFDPTISGVSAEFYGNPIFHGDVNVYNNSLWLDEHDHDIFYSTATTQGNGEIRLLEGVVNLSKQVTLGPYDSE